MVKKGMEFLTIPLHSVCQPFRSLKNGSLFGVCKDRANLNNYPIQNLANNKDLDGVRNDVFTDKKTTNCLEVIYG